MSASEILKVIYSPRKAFNEIIQNPKYLGPLLIVVLVIAANVGFTYTAISKTDVEQILPNGSKFDEWTENSTLWTSNTAVSESDDHVNGSLYGDKSIEFSMNDSSQVLAQLNGVGSVNCSSPDGFSELSFRIKWTSPPAEPGNVTLYLLSGDSSDYFYHDLTENISTPNIWNNMTVQLVAEGWSASSPNADWSTITGLKFQFTWSGGSNVNLLIDGLFFHGPFKSLLESAGTSYLANYAIMAAMQFVITWVLLSGLIYIITKGLGGTLVWRPLLIVVGFILVTLFIQAAINVAAYSTLPTIRYPFRLIAGVSGEGQDAYDTILDQTWLVSEIARFTQIGVHVWIVALCSMAVRILAAFSWTKSILVGAVAYVATILAEGFLIG